MPEHTRPSLAVPTPKRARVSVCTRAQHDRDVAAMSRRPLRKRHVLWRLLALTPAVLMIVVTVPQPCDVHRMLRRRAQAAAEECELGRDDASDCAALRAWLRAQGTAERPANASHKLRRAPSGLSDGHASAPVGVWLDVHGEGSPRYMFAALRRGAEIPSAVTEWANTHAPALLQSLSHADWIAQGRLVGRQLVGDSVRGETLRLRYHCLPGGAKKRAQDENVKHCKDTRAKARAKELAQAAAGTPTLASLFNRPHSGHSVPSKGIRPHKASAADGGAHSEASALMRRERLEMLPATP